MTSTGAELLDRWHDLMPSSQAAELGGELVERYGSPRRHYHDLRHLAEVLDVIDLLSAEAGDVDAVRLAAWFHDAVYDPHRADNEEESARLAEERLPVCGVAAEQVAAVARLVRLTAGHDPSDGDPDGAVLCDADLAILAADPQRYGDYVADVRAEYAHLDDETFRRGRAAVLETLLGHGRLFRTPLGRSTWEERARHNLTAELALLRADS
jgi:predicted metal-dependent HD superfamily phosphohydrolase